jgi:hypothetical protein
VSASAHRSGNGQTSVTTATAHLPCRDQPQRQFDNRRDRQWRRDRQHDGSPGGHISSVTIRSGSSGDSSDFTRDEAAQVGGRKTDLVLPGPFRSFGLD